MGSGLSVIRSLFSIDGFGRGIRSTAERWMGIWSVYDRDRGRLSHSFRWRAGPRLVSRRGPEGTDGMTVVKIVFAVDLKHYLTVVDVVPGGVQLSSSRESCFERQDRTLGTILGDDACCD